MLEVVAEPYPHQTPTNLSGKDIGLAEPDPSVGRADRSLRGAMFQGSRKGEGNAM